MRKTAGRQVFDGAGCAHTDWYRRPLLLGGNMWRLLERVKNACAHGLVPPGKDGGQAERYRRLPVPVRNTRRLLERVKNVCAYGLVLCEKDGVQAGFWWGSCAYTDR